MDMVLVTIHPLEVTDLKLFTSYHFGFGFGV